MGAEMQPQVMGNRPFVVVCTGTCPGGRKAMRRGFGVLALGRLCTNPSDELYVGE